MPDESGLRGGGGEWEVGGWEVENEDAGRQAAARLIPNQILG